MDKGLILLTHLRDDCRASLASISRLTHIPISTLFDRIRELEEGFILKHTALLDSSRLGFLVRVILILAPGIGEEALSHPAINNLFRIPEGYYAEYIFRSIKELFDFTQEHKPILEIHVIEDLERERVLSGSKL